MPAELDVHLILDNSAIHETALIRRWLAQRPRYHVHFTPTSSSWLNLVEKRFGLLTEKQLRHGAYLSTRKLEEATARRLESTNAHAKPFAWTKNAEEILASPGHFCMRSYNSGHKMTKRSRRPQRSAGAKQMVRRPTALQAQPQRDQEAVDGILVHIKRRELTIAGEEPGSIQKLTGYEIGLAIPEWDKNRSLVDSVRKGITRSRDIQPWPLPRATKLLSR